MKVVIAGAGIFGVTAALELCRRGHEVALCDAGAVPHPHAESTDVSKVVRMDYADDFYVDLMAETLRGWDAWNAQWGERLYHEVGFLVLTRETMSPASFEHQAWSALVRRGYPVERLDGATVSARFPAWAENAHGDGYLNPRAGWAESGRVVARLVAEARTAGVIVREGAGVAEIVVARGRASGVVTVAGEMLPADLVVVAAGAWTPLLVPRLRDRIWSTAQPVLHFGAADPTLFQPRRFPVWAAEISREGWYGFPALQDGTVKIANHGAGRPAHPNDGRRADPADEDRFRQFLRRSLPALAGAPLIESRACLYSDTWDGDFYIDHDPDCAGLVVAAGGSGHGFKFAPSLGAIIADVVERRPNRWAERFRWRPRGRELAARR